MEERLESLDEYASETSWLLKFLYNRYDKFSDLETEVLEGCSRRSPVGEADERDKDLKRALKLIRVTMKASGRTENENLMDNIAFQFKLIQKGLLYPINPSKVKRENRLTRILRSRSSRFLIYSYFLPKGCLACGQGIPLFRIPISR
jgi:hypothetical protein